MPPVEPPEIHHAAGTAGDPGFERPFWELPATGFPEEAASGDSAQGLGSAPFADERPPSGEAGPGPAAAGDEGPPPLPLPPENVLSLSSFVFGRDPVELEVNAELHIFGRVKPGSRLQLFGREVRVRPDGTFSVHRPLGSGAAIMPVLMTEEDEARAAEETAPGAPGGRDETPGESG